MSHLYGVQRQPCTDEGGQRDGDSEGGRPGAEDSEERGEAESRGWEGGKGGIEGTGHNLRGMEAALWCWRSVAAHGDDMG